MGNKMLIDATHPEETRVVVTRGNRVEEFDYESAARKQLRGNIYLAKIARIEPSLQAAFVNYGGNRHGFLAFAEIHPDYYQIPVAVREAMKREEALERQNRLRDNGDADFDGRKEHEAAEDGASAAAEQAETHVDAAAEVADTASDSSPENGQPESQAHSGEVEEHEEDGHAHGAALALEAILPQAVYAEFSEAVSLAESVRDEIPAHPDDVASEAERVDTAIANTSPSAHEPADAGEHIAAIPLEPQAAAEAQNAVEGETASAEPVAAAAEEQAPWDSQAPSEDGSVVSLAEAATQTPVEVVGSEDALEELPQRHKRRWRHYKIQEVIKRNQIVLVQVVKEERGTKGAALTTYLSLAGRYTVLMPNTPSGGGISRKITVPADRKRLKEIAHELDVPEGMGLIIRTAGASRTKAEIKRDFEYLLRLWENVRDLTLKSTAPCLVYEEGDLIKRSIRDLYNKDIDEILVAGENAYRDAKEFMRMLMPSHAKNVQLYKEPEPLFIKYEVERQLNQMFSPVVTLKSGGYIVLNQTEALVAIDVNSGRATREYSIEDTALKTNLEAAEEVARQVRLRDLAGLIVIDFIDMDERRNNRAVERRLKECLRHDRARIQVGHISHFGLLEMSRQRLRQGVVEVSTMPCPVCQGVGHIRSTESVALMILRAIEDNLRTQGAVDITATAAPEAALYILNHKRAYLHDIEARYGVTILVQTDEKAHGSHFVLERAAEATPPAGAVQAIQPQSLASEAEEDEDGAGEEGEDKRPSRRRRRRRRGRSGDQAGERHVQNGGTHPAEFADDEGASEEDDDEPEEEGAGLSEAPHLLAGAAVAHEGDEEREGGLRKNRRRGRRGGRRHRGDASGGSEFPPRHGNGQHIPGLGEQPVVDFAPPASAPLGAPEAAPTAPAHAASFSDEVPQMRPEAIAAGSEATIGEGAAAAGAGAANSTTIASSATTGTWIEGEAESANSAEPAPSVPVAVMAEERPQKPARMGPPRKGWWQRRTS